MKINTKTATPVKGSPNSFVNDNKAIPASRLQDKPNDQGREILYETFLVTTPVLASARLNPPQDGSPKRFLAKSEVDELNDMLNSLYIGSPSPSSPATKKEDPATVKKEIKAEAGETKEQDDEQTLGRCESSVYDPKSESLMTVLRSVRFMD